MPVYEYRCRDCETEYTRFLPISRYKEQTHCDCGGEGKKLISAPHVIEDIQPYRSVVTGERIKGRSHHRTHLRDHNLIELGNERIEAKKKPLPPVGPDIKRAIEELSQ